MFYANELVFTETSKHPFPAGIHKCALFGYNRHGNFSTTSTSVKTISTSRSMKRKKE
jgi:hypothetical protein